MSNQSIEDVYATNNKIRESLKAMVGNLSEEQASILPDGEKWTIAALVEHIGIVNGGMIQICQKLLSQVQPDGEKTDGTTKLSDNFKEKAAQIGGIKLEAPERVHPTGKQTIAESLAKIEANSAELEKLRPLFTVAESDKQTFPHPFMGNLSAHEWLVLIGGHEMRHLTQLKKLIEKIN